MLTSILEEIITGQFDSTVGKDQERKGQYQAMEMEFNLNPYYEKDEEGYRHLLLRIYAPMNYVAVIIKETWNVIDRRRLVNDDKIEDGYDYIEGGTGWLLVSYHDSTWRSAVHDILSIYRDRLSTLGRFRRWYEKITLTPAESSEIRKLISLRDKGERSGMWTRKPVSSLLDEEARKTFYAGAKI